MHTDKNYISPRERINLSLARRVAEGCSSPFEEASVPTCACNRNAGNHSRPRKSWGLENYPLASVYSPIQIWRDIYDEDTGFHRGTIFKELDLPFVCGEKRGGNCRGK